MNALHQPETLWPWPYSIFKETVEHLWAMLNEQMTGPHTVLTPEDFQRAHRVNALANNIIRFESASLWTSHGHTMQLCSTDHEILAVHRQAMYAPTRKANDGYTPQGIWRAIGPDCMLWAESSDEQEIRQRMRPTDKLQQLYGISHSEWRDE